MPETMISLANAEQREACYRLIYEIFCAEMGILRGDADHHSRIVRDEGVDVSHVLCAQVNNEIAGTMGIIIGNPNGDTFPDHFEHEFEVPRFLPVVPRHRNGTVYNTADSRELLDMARAENGFLYQTHPRTKGSMGYPDEIRDTPYFRDAHWFGAGWKALPSDLSLPRMGERAFKLLDDMSNWGLSKLLLGEVDVFQIDSTHELYAHMNVNYVKLPAVPTFDNYGNLLDALRRGEFFVSTGEVLLPEVNIAEGTGGRITVRARIHHTFPLEMAEIVWGDGTESHRKVIPLTETRPYGDFSFTADAEGGNWKWARFAVWDVAADGAFVNPVRRAHM